MNCPILGRAPLLLSGEPLVSAPLIEENAAEDMVEEEEATTREKVVEGEGVDDECEEEGEEVVDLEEEVEEQEEYPVFVYLFPQPPREMGTCH